MIKTEIIKNGVVTHRATHNTQALAQAWVTEVAATGAFGSGYTVSYTDISTEVAIENLKALRTRKRAFGESMIDSISTINEAKGLTTAQTDAFMSDPLITSLREHLYAGNITTFVDKLQASDVSAYFTNAEKQSVIDQCNNFLNSLGGN